MSLVFYLVLILGGFLAVRLAWKDKLDEAKQVITR